MSDNRVKVVGYAQRVYYNDGIEYRNFSDDLVGTQLASNGGTSLFTIGNFAITTNLDDKISKLFYTSNFSDYVDLKNLKFTNDDIIAILTESNKIKLNLDKSELTNYALFGSFTEFIRVSLENIILNWPASLYMSPANEFNANINYQTVEDYTYDAINGISSFKILTNSIRNKFGINFLKNGNIINSFTNVNDLRNLAVNYSDYVVSTDNGDFNIINFTGSTGTINDYIYVEVSGDAFKDYGSFNVQYHIKPSSLKIEKFFKTLNDFESYLLNRFSTPIYTSTFKYDVLSESGNLILSEKNITWPISDAYNIDFESDAYITFVSDLLEIAENSDLTKTNLMTRFLVSESISDFDTLPTLNHEDYASGQKITSLLNVYGREFDEIKKYIDGISFANVVSYDKKNNVPDALVKNLARVLGWDVTSSILEIDLINNYLSVNNSSYSGHSVSLSPIEAEVELWRRLILNSPWLWKSKGTRKSIEFLFKFIGTPNGLITFNEFIYVAENSMNMSLFNTILEELTDSTSIDGLNIDSEGYPLIQPDNSDMYFQKAGLWYRETGGPNSKEDILYGNNPHIGPYDGGQEYIDQFRNIIPNFEPVTIVNENKYNTQDNLFINYDEGTFNGIFNNDVVATFNLQEWLDNANNEMYSSLLEGLTNYQVQPDISSCTAVVGIIMSSYLDNSLIITQDIDDYPYSTNDGLNDGFGDTADIINKFKLFLDLVVSTLNTNNSTNLYGYIDENNVYSIVDDLDKCDDGSFYSNKIIDINFDFGYSYQCDGGDCDPKSLDVANVDSETGFVSFNNVLNDIVPSATCCTNLGFNAVPVNGGFNCYSDVKNDINCDDYVPTKADNDGYMIFFGPEGATYYVPTAQCCPIGTTAVPNIDATLFKCLSDESVCDDYIPNGIDRYDRIIFSTPSGTTFYIPDSGCCPTYTTAEMTIFGSYFCTVNCTPYTSYTYTENVVVFEYSGGTFTEMPISSCCPSGYVPKAALSESGQATYICTLDTTPSGSTPSISSLITFSEINCEANEIIIGGTPGDIINYRVEVINNGNHGYTSTMVGDNNTNYPAMASGSKPPIIIPSDGTLILTWECCARPTIRANQSNCVSVNMIFSHNGIDILTVNAYACSD